MPWKYKDRVIRAGKAWIDDNGIKHPNVWMRWTDAEKKAFGLTWEDPPASEAAFDNRFYHGRKTDGTLIEKSLTDVNVTRKAETNKAIPSDVSTFRTAVRASCEKIETAINAVKTHAKFMALYDDELNSDGTVKTVAPIRDWPDAI